MGQVGDEAVDEVAGLAGHADDVGVAVFVGGEGPAVQQVLWRAGEDDGESVFLGAPRGPADVVELAFGVGGEVAGGDGAAAQARQAPVAQQVPEPERCVA